MKHIAILIVAALALAPAVRAFVPEPTSVTVDGGDFTYDSGSRVFYETRSTSRAVENTLLPLAEVLAGELEIITGIKPAVVENSGGSTPGAGDISLEFDAVSGSFATSEEDEDQSYTLEVADTVTVASEYYKGVAYGTTTLLQSIVDSSGVYTVPKMSVSDTPASGYRTIMIDVARQPSSIGMLKEVVRLARQYKLRYLQLHLTDDQNFTFPFTPVTDNISGNFVYDRADLQDLAAYADARGVTIVPEFDLPGHSTKLKQSGYLDPSSSDWDVADPANYDKIQTIIDDMLSVFTSTPYFHMGGDESGAGSRLVPFLEAMNNHLRGTPTGGKRRMLVWEGFHGAPTTELPATGGDRIIVLSWESSYNAPWDLLNAGYEVVNASWKPLYVVGSGATHRYIHVSQRMWSPQILHSWDKDTFMHWEPGRPVFEDAGPNDPDLNDGIWNANWISRQDQVIGGQMLSWEQNEKTIVRDLLPRLPVMADRLWNPLNGEDYATFEARLDAVRETALAIVRPVEILPLSEDSVSPINEDYRVYTGGNVTLTMRNRSKIPGTIRYETAGFSNDRSHCHFDSVDETTASSSAYPGPFSRSGGFGIRAQLYRQDDGTPVDGNDWQHFNNWDNRVRVTEYEVPRRAMASAPDFTTYPGDQVNRVYELPVLRGPYVTGRTYGQKFDAILQVPGSGSYEFSMGAAGQTSVYIDLDQDGVWDVDEKIISGEGDATVTLAQDDYRLRVDHASNPITPTTILNINGPGTGGSKDVTNYLTLPVDPTTPPPAPDPITPADGASAVFTDEVLYWTANGATSYDVFLWKSGDSIPGTPTATVTGTLYRPAILDPQTSYFWKVDSHNAHGTTGSATWSFATGDGIAITRAHEPFAYTGGETIHEKDGGEGWDGGWNLETGNGTIETVSTSLTYGTLPTSGGALRINPATDNPSIDLSRDVDQAMGDEGKTLWFSYLFRGDPVGSGHAFMKVVGSPGIGKRWGSEFAFENDGSGVSMSSGQTYFVVVRIDFGANDSDNMYMWINPSLDSEPAVGAADHSIITGVGNGSRFLFNFQGYGQGDYTIDEIRLGPSWDYATGGGGPDPGDSDPPDPDPMSWGSQPVLQGATAAEMSATAATDAWPVEYLFEETSGNPGGTSSGWQTGSTYTDDGLQAGYTYTYRVKARDTSPQLNETGWSPSASVELVLPGEATPTTPQDAASGLGLSPTVEWTAATGATSYDVYFGTTDPLGAGDFQGNQAAITFDPGLLNPNTTYYWRIDPVNAYGTTIGTTWSFTTGDAPTLLLHEDFEGYAFGSSLHGLPGQGIGETGNWDFFRGTGNMIIGAGLSGGQGLVIDADGGDNDITIGHTVPGWGSGQLWMSFLYNESVYGGHFYVATGGGFEGGAGHQWNSALLGLHNEGPDPGFPYTRGETNRLVVLYDWDVGTTTLWVDPDPAVQPVTDPAAPGFAADSLLETEVPSPTNQTLRIASYNTDGIIDDIRIGPDYYSVVGEIAEPGILITDFSLDGDSATVIFTGAPGVTGWKIMASADLVSFDIDETPSSVITEDAPGVYSAIVDVASDPSPYFLRVEG